MKYIDSEKLIAEIEKYENSAIDAYNPLGEDADLWHGKVVACEDLKTFIASLQQEQPIEGKQVIIITETDGDANIKWDCRSLDDVIVLLKSAENFIAEKQIEKIAGPGSGPDYATTEGRYSRLFKRRQEQQEGDLEKEMDSYFNEHFSPCVDGTLISERTGMEIGGNDYDDIARHFYKLGLNARKED